MALIVVVLACAGLRLLPAAWKLRKSNISNRTWLAVALSLILLATWYGSSGSRLPHTVYRRRCLAGCDNPSCEETGLHFHEKAVSVRRDSGFHLWQNERKWFQYRFANQGLRATAPENVVRRQVMALLNSPELANLGTPPATPLRRWNDEGLARTDAQVSCLCFRERDRATAGRDRAFHYGRDTALQEIVGTVT